MLSSVFSTPFTFTQLLSRTVCFRIALLIVVDFRFVSTLLIDERELLLRFSVSCKRLSVTESSSMLGLSDSWRQYTCLWICLQLQLIINFYHTFYFLFYCFQRSKKSLSRKEYDHLFRFKDNFLDQIKFLFNNFCARHCSQIRTLLRTSLEANFLHSDRDGIE